MRPEADISAKEGRRQWADIVDLVAALFRRPRFQSMVHLLACCLWIGLGIGADSFGSVMPAPASGRHRSKLASFLRFWAVAASRNSSRVPLGPRNPEATESEDALEMGEQHLGLLPAVT
jgi:hypothetical protein